MRGSVYILALFASISLFLILHFFNHHEHDEQQQREVSKDHHIDRYSTTTVEDEHHPLTSIVVELFLMRHAQGTHNTKGIHIFDAPLTRLGREQAVDAGINIRASHFSPPHNSPPDLILASPLRRTIETSILAFPPSFLNSSKITLLPELMEAHDKPCDTGVEAAEFVPRGYITSDELRSFDVSRLRSGWFQKGPEKDTEARGLKRGKKLQAVLSKILREEIMVRRRGGHSVKRLRVVIVYHGGISRFWLFNGQDKRRMHHAEVFGCKMIMDPRRVVQLVPECDFKSLALPGVVTI